MTQWEVMSCEVTIWLVDVSDRSSCKETFSWSDKASKKQIGIMFSIILRNIPFNFKKYCEQYQSMVGFLKTILKTTNRNTPKTNAYITLVRPHIEFCISLGLGCTRAKFLPKSWHPMGSVSKYPTKAGCYPPKNGGDKKSSWARPRSPHFQSFRECTNPLKVYTDQQMFSHFRFRQFDVFRTEQGVRTDVEFAYRRRGSLSHTTQV